MRWNRRLPALVVTLVLVSAGARAQAPKADALLANCGFYISAPDLGKTWSSLSATPLYAAVDSLLNGPAVQSDTDWRKFLNAKTDLEAQLGFSISPKDLFGGILKSLTISAAPPSTPGSRATFLIRLDLSNPEKFRKMFDYFEQKAWTRAASAPSDAESAPASGRPVAEPYGNTEIVTLAPRPGRTESAYGALFGSTWAASNDKAVLRQAIDGKGSALGAPPAVAEALKQMKNNAPDLQLFIQPDSILKMMGALNALGLGGPAQLPIGEMKSIVANAAVSASEISLESASLIDPAAKGLLSQAAQVAPTDLPGLSFAPREAWIVATANNLNAGLIVELMRQLLGASGNPQLLANFNAGLAQADQSLGMSVEKDLIPAIGSNVVLALNKVAPNLIMLPSSEVDLTFGVQVLDQNKIRAVLRKLEQDLQAQAAPPPPATTPGSAPPPIELFKSETYQGVEIRYASLPMAPTLTPGYAIDGGFLLFNPKIENLKAAIDCRRGTAPSAATSPEFKALVSRLGHSEMNKVLLIRIGAIVQKIREIVLPFLQMNAGAAPNPDVQGFTAALDAAGSIQSLGVATRWNGQALYTTGQISFGTTVRQASPASPATAPGAP